MSEPRTITAADLLEGTDIDANAKLEGPELVKAFWILRGQRREREQQAAAWSAELERRVEAQVEERSRALAAAMQKLSRGDRWAPLSTGDVIGDRVRIGAVLGHGGMGAVYAGHDLRSGERVALKVMHADVEATPATFTRFVAEAEAASRVAHPSVVRTLHLDVTAEGRLYQVMELVDGVDLATRLASRAAGARGSRLPSLESARICAGVARALAAAHAAGVVHCDVKPSNVMLCDDARGDRSVRVLDFGIAKVLRAQDTQDQAAGEPDLAITTCFVGTPAYASPEQLLGTETITPATDVYSLGVMLCELLTGERPYPPIAGADARPCSACSGPDVPHALGALARRCLAPRSIDRPSAAEVAAELEAFLEAEPPKDSSVRMIRLAVGESG